MHQLVLRTLQPITDALLKSLLARAQETVPNTDDGAPHAKYLPDPRRNLSPFHLSFEENARHTIPAPHRRTFLTADGKEFNLHLVFSFLRHQIMTWRQSFSILQIRFPNRSLRVRTVSSRRGTTQICFRYNRFSFGRSRGRHDYRYAVNIDMFTCSSTSVLLDRPVRASALSRCWRSELRDPLIPSGCARFCGQPEKCSEASKKA